MPGTPNLQFNMLSFMQTAQENPLPLGDCPGKPEELQSLPRYPRASLKVPSDLKIHSFLLRLEGLGLWIHL